MTTRTYTITSRKGLGRTFDELKQKIEEVENQAKEMMRAGKSPIYREYAKKIAVFIPAQYVQSELCRHFEKDDAIIRYALKDLPQYRNLHEDQQEEESSSRNCEPSNIDSKNNTEEDFAYKDYCIQQYEHGKLIIDDTGILDDMKVALGKFPSKLIITHNKGVAIEVNYER